MATKTALRPMLWEVTVNCGHKRRMRQPPREHLHCRTCGKRREVIKVKSHRR